MWIFDNVVTKPAKATGLITGYVNKNIKLGTSLIVPENFRAYLVYKDKIWNEFSSGKYILNNTSISELIEYQSTTKTFKSKSKKRIRADIYFIDKSEYVFQYRHNVRRYKYKNKFVSKMKIDVIISYYIENQTNFLLACLNNYSYLKNSDADKSVYDWFKEDIIYLLKKNTLPDQSCDFDYDYNKKILESIYDEYQKIGIMITDIQLIKIDIIQKNKIKSNELSNINQNTENIYIHGNNEESDFNAIDSLFNQYSDNNSNNEDSKCYLDENKDEIEIEQNCENINQTSEFIYQNDNLNDESINSGIEDKDLNIIAIDSNNISKSSIEILDIPNSSIDTKNINNKIFVKSETQNTLIKKNKNFLEKGSYLVTNEDFDDIIHSENEDKDK